MTDNVSVPRSRRALLVAAAGGAAALAASAALPLAAVANDPDDVQKDVDNPTLATTGITNGTADLTAFTAAAVGTGYGVQGTSDGAAGLLGWSVSEPDPGWFSPDITIFTGVFGSAPASTIGGFTASGVWGDSDDVGVYGSGSVGVLGIGGIGVLGESTTANAGVLALGQDANSLALQVVGKVRFSRSGRASIAKNKSSKVVSLAGMTSGSHVLAVIQSNRSGRWVRAVVPASGKFTIYLNTTVRSTTSVAWFVLN